MSRTFAYVRVSTAGQTTENQVKEIEAAGFRVDPSRIHSETISGSAAIAQRPVFKELMVKLEAGDILIVTKLDRLGRDAIDVTTTVTKLSAMGVKVHCLALGGVDLTSSAGMMTMNVLNAVAQFERDLLIERTHAGLERTKAMGTRLGRRPKLNEEQVAIAAQETNSGKSISAIAKSLGVSRQTIMRSKDKLPQQQTHTSV